MVTVICQHSGIEFEADSKRTKQHPLIARIKQQASKDGTYREMDAALVAVSRDGGYASIEEYVTCVRDMVAGVPTLKTRVRVAQLERDEEARQSRERHRRENEVLKANGYQWSKEASYDYIGGHDDDPRYQWILRDPAGTEISTSQALDEIARGRDTVNAENNAKAQAARVAQHDVVSREATELAVQDAAIEAFDDATEQIVAGLIECERFDYSLFTGSEILVRMGVYKSAARRHDHITRGKVNGVDVVIVTTGSGYDDGGYWTPYCADPDNAGLIRKAPHLPAERSFF